MSEIHLFRQYYSVTAVYKGFYLNGHVIGSCANHQETFGVAVRDAINIRRAEGELLEEIPFRLHGAVGVIC